MTPVLKNKNSKKNKFSTDLNDAEKQKQAGSTPLKSTDGELATTEQGLPDSSTSQHDNDIDNGCTRLIAKNLPSAGKKNKWDEEKLRSFFGKFGKITDVKFKLNEHTGACRFVFVGFEEANCCQSAIEKLNGTFYRGTKLQIEQCQPLSTDRKAITKKFTLLKLAQKHGKDLDDQSKSTDEKFIENQIMDTGRLFVRNLPYSCTEEKLNNLFNPFGPLAEVECIIDRSGQCKGFALITFMFPEHALEAWQTLDGKIFMGRMLHIIAGEEKVKKTDGNQAKALSSFQRERQHNLKENASKTQHTWNSLFLGTNAIAENLAESYEIEKRHLLLDQGESSAAVRMAMAETRLVRETRKFLLGQGIKLDAFSQSQQNAKRSKTVILVKNLNGKSGESERLRQFFARFGQVKNVIMPPSHGISALVEMESELEAKNAFEALAYTKKFPSTNGQPLYLEWAPIDVFDEQHPSRRTNKKKEQTEDVGSTLPESDNEEETNEPTDQNKKEPERTKILVRNVPFQANLKEITQLFSAFGELKFVRMPKKPGGEGHRGFCFVDFLSVGDTRRAMESLAHSTHLYGRRLVLEWAKQEETMEELRSKTKRKDQGRKQLGGKKSKMRSFDTSD